MPNINHSLRATVQDGKTIFLEKFTLAKTDLGPTNTDIVQMGADMGQLFAQFDKPDFWARQINFDANSLNEQFIVLGSQSSDDGPGLLRELQKLLRMLQQIVENANQELAPGDTSQVFDMNLKVLDALRITRQQINTRLDTFAAAGQDLRQEADFQAMKARQDELIQTYRDKLLRNAIKSIKTDVIIVSRAGSILATAVSPDAFKTNYGQLTRFIQLKVGA